MKTAQPKLKIIWKYAKVELTPPSPRDLPQVKRTISDLIRAAKTGRWKTTTVREAWLNTLITAEVFLWFFVGEIIGKRHIVGYKV